MHEARESAIVSSERFIVRPATAEFELTRRVRRMRLGPPVPGYRPEAIFNVFSLAAG
jgi:hypothetical protein